METQIQLGMKPQWRPYLLLIFFATLFEYNLHRLITLLTNEEALQSEKYQWVRENQRAFYLLIIVSVVGFISSVLIVKKEVVVALLPIALITVFYSIPVFFGRVSLFRLREIPYFKIFLIAFVWASSTLLLPIVESGLSFDRTHVILIFIERFFFIFSIAIPFDIRDIQLDKQTGLKTIPMLFSENKSFTISYVSLLVFFIISIFHYRILNYDFLIAAFGISFLITLICLYSKKIRSLEYYHHGILDGSMLLQGILVIAFSQLQ